jgi:hypothetical protein
MSTDSIVLADKATPRGKYPHAKRVGDFIFVSGTSSRRADNSIAGASVDAMGTSALDIRVQTRAVQILAGPGRTPPPPPGPGPGPNPKPSAGTRSWTGTDLAAARQRLDDLAAQQESGSLAGEVSVTITWTETAADDGAGRSPAGGAPG